MPLPGVKPSLRLAAWWSGGALVVAGSAGTLVLVAQQEPATAAREPVASGSGTASGKGSGGGNNGGGVGNSPGGAQPAVKALLVDEVVGAPMALNGRSTITVSVLNPNNQAVELTGVTTSLSVKPAAGASCPVGSFELPGVTGLRQRLEKAGASQGRDRTTIDLQLRLVERGVNQDGCKSAALNFTYTATAEQAARP